jgi:hypothetical protein
MNNVDKKSPKYIEYLEYLLWAQGDCKVPDKTYTDWTGDKVLSYEDWLKKQKHE